MVRHTLVYGNNYMCYIGCYHSVCAHFCGCEQEAETLLRSHLFPATPKHPQLAFDFSLLDWFEALLWECQVSAQDFVGFWQSQSHRLCDV